MSDRAFALDVVVEGERVRRGARLELAETELRLEDRTLPFAPVFWVSRRAGLLLIFARDYTAALKGRGQDLEELARAVERGSDRSRRRRELLRPFASEVVVCTAGTAVTGTLAGAELSGLHLAVFTQRALHLLARDRHHRVPWPVERAQRARSSDGHVDHETLLLRGEGTSLRLRYLFPEEVRAALRVAEMTPRGAEAARSDALELFARSEVARPLPARLPELTVSVATLQRSAAEAAGRVPEAPRENAGMPPHFFELHLQELGEIALGPLMLRKSAAAGTRGFRRALEVMDVRGLREDTDAAVRASAGRLAAAYAQEAGRWADDRRRQPAAPLQVGEAEREAIARRMAEPIGRLAPLFARLETCQESLRARLEAYEGAPPDAEDAGLEEAVEEWRTALRRLDRAYGLAWREMLEEIVDVWCTTLLPRLARVRAERRTELPEWARVAGAVVGVLLLVAVLVLLL